MSNLTPIICIYHAGCSDGYASAAVVHKYYDGNVHLIPGIYQQEPNQEFYEDIKDHVIFIVDFSYPRDILIKMADYAEHIVIIDHHKTAQVALSDLDLDNMEIHFDMEKSGAALTWSYFYPGVNYPDLILYVQDRDLWRFKYRDETRAYNAAIRVEPFDITQWVEYLDDTLTDGLMITGYALLQKHDNEVDNIVNKHSFKTHFAGYLVPVANCNPQFISDVGNKLAINEPFAVMYYDLEDKRIFSLRSAKDGLDVSEIATQYGGGGHKHAAGFSMKIYGGDNLLTRRTLEE